MKFLILFCLLATVAAMGKPVRPDSDKPYFGATNEDPKEYEVVSVKKQLVSGWWTTLDIIFQESTCDTNKNLKEITAENCPVNSNGRRSAWRVTDHHQPWLKQHFIAASEIMDFQFEIIPTSTLSSNNGYTVSDNTEPTIEKRNARDLKHIYEWH